MQEYNLSKYFTALPVMDSQQSTIEGFNTDDIPWDATHARSPEPEPTESRPGPDEIL
jgi:hypothetical protein